MRLLSSLLLVTTIAAALPASTIASAGADVRDDPAADAPGGSVPLELSLVTFATGLSDLIGIASAGDDRLFALDQDGVIRIIRSNGSVDATPFLDITARVDSSSNEEGLLGLAFHPDYAVNGFFYLQYTNTTSGTRRTRVSRFSVTGDPDVADPNSENILLTIIQPLANHNSGKINFGPDGYLYIPMGDGGGGGDTANNAQTVTTLLGKVVRIDVDSSGGTAPDCVDVGTGNYTVPADNPFTNGSGGICDEIWAIGLRNPWQSSFDRQTGDLWIGDVGQNAVEEVNRQPFDSTGGENYGWRCYEGNDPFNLSGCGPMNTYTFPAFAYDQDPGGHCSVVGGYVYRGSQFPNMHGRYLLTDYCSGRFWDLEPDGGGGFTATSHTNLQAFGYTTFGEDANGELYLGQQSGTIYRIVDLSQVPPLGFTQGFESPDCPEYFTDADEDTFGDPLTRVFGCEGPPPGLVDNGLDCYDDNSDARPTQTAWFTTHRGDGSFDYNCDDLESKQFNAVRTCEYDEFTFTCSGSGGWDAPVPACGNAGLFTNKCANHPTLPQCAAGQSRTQSCH